VDENFNVVVDENCVEAAAQLYEEMVRRWEYEDYVYRRENVVQFTEQELDEVISKFEEDILLRQVFETIAENQGIKRIDIAIKLGVSEREIQRNISILRLYMLIDSRERMPGYRLSKKGIQFYKQYYVKTFHDRTEDKEKVYKDESEKNENDI
jgi:hypothetical protein